MIAKAPRSNASSFVAVIGLLVVSIFVELPAVSGQDTEEWVELFNGRDLAGWRRVGGEAEFQVENGEIVGVSRPSPVNSFLVTEKGYDDFVLELEFRVAARNNSGVQVRSASRATERGDVVFGYQVEIDPSERAWTGGIYDESRRGWLYPLTLNEPARGALLEEQWNRLRIECQGDRIRTWLNGTPAADLIDDETRSGFIALQVHAPIPGVFDRESVVRFRNLRLRPGASKGVVPEEELTGAPFVVNMLPNRLSRRESEQGWRLLFDGSTTEGWRGIHQPSEGQHGWSVADGELRTPGYSNSYNNKRQYSDARDLVTSDELEAFELQLEFRFAEAGNSGIKYLVPEPKRSDRTAADSRHGLGLEYQILDDEKHPDATGPRGELRKLGALYDLIAADKQARFVRGPGEWNHARIVFRSDGTVEHWLNHLLVVAYDRRSATFRELVGHSKYRDYEGFGSWNRGRILLQDHGDPVAFRNIKVRPLQ